jgi:hypothetical protein
MASVAWDSSMVYPIEFVLLRPVEPLVVACRRLVVRVTLRATRPVSVFDYLQSSPYNSGSDSIRPNLPHARNGSIISESASVLCHEILSITYKFLMGIFTKIAA